MVSIEPVAVVVYYCCYSSAVAAAEVAIESAAGLPLDFHNCVDRSRVVWEYFAHWVPARFDDWASSVVDIEPVSSARRCLSVDEIVVGLFGLSWQYLAWVE